MKLAATFDTYDGSLETVSSEFFMRILKADVSLGQTYDRKENIMLYKAGIEFSPHRSVNISSSIWYDAKGGGLRDMDVTVLYQRQCWGLKFEMIKRPGDFTTLFTVELAGLNREPLEEKDEVAQKDNLTYASSAGE